MRLTACHQDSRAQFDAAKGKEGQEYARKRVAWHLGNTRPAGQLTGPPVAFMIGA
jgi:hypothetical protein